MNMLVERTCTELGRNGPDSPDAESKPLSAYRSAQAYVLLGDPGSGKTTSFEAECEELGDQARFISARDFLVYGSAPDELRGKTLFIDGLDEVRAGASDVRSPFDRIRGLLISWADPGSGFRAARRTGLVKTTCKVWSLLPRIQQSLPCGWIPSLRQTSRTS